MLTLSTYVTTRLKVMINQSLSKKLFKLSKLPHVQTMITRGMGHQRLKLYSKPREAYRSPLRTLKERTHSSPFRFGYRIV